MLIFGRELLKIGRPFLRTFLKRQIPVKECSRIDRIMQAVGDEMNLQRQLYFQQCVEKICRDEKVLSMDKNHQHGDTSCLEHSISVAYASFRFCTALHITVDSESLIRGALLHDFFLYDRKENPRQHRWHGFTHPAAALANAERAFDLTRIERDIIKKHMFPLTVQFPRFRESYVVCLWDKICCLNELYRFSSQRFRRMLRTLFSRAAA